MLETKYLKSPAHLYNSSTLSPALHLVPHKLKRPSLPAPPPSCPHSPLGAAGPACGWWSLAGCHWRSRSGRWGWGPWIFSSWRSRAAWAPALHTATSCGGSGRSPPAGVTGQIKTSTWDLAGLALGGRNLLLSSTAQSNMSALKIECKWY